jgi:hypothetical protein
MNDGGPAFPNNRGYSGMSLRDYFASQALPPTIKEFNGSAGRSDAIAEATYRIADAMLKARKEG